MNNEYNSFISMVGGTLIGAAVTLFIMLVSMPSACADSLSIGYDAKHQDNLIAQYERPLVAYGSLSLVLQTTFSSDSDHLGGGASVQWSSKKLDLSLGTGEYLAADNDRQPTNRQYMVQAFYKITKTDSVGLVHTSNCLQLCPEAKISSGLTNNQAYNWITYRREVSF